MSDRDAQQVCLNGHQITTGYHDYPTSRKDHCDECGEPTIHECPHCKSEIPGRYRPGRMSMRMIPTKLPAHCANCGEPYPWTERRKELLQMQGKTANQSDPVARVRLLCSRFHVVANQLRVRHDKRKTIEVEDEYDVHDLLHALLKILFEDVRYEEGTPSHAGRSSRMDFLLKREQIVIEVKKTREGLGPKEIGDELSIDIEHYRIHPDCKTLFCFVYDPEYRIGNPVGLENDLSRDTGEFVVRVLVDPKQT